LGLGAELALPLPDMLWLPLPLLLELVVWLAAQVSCSHV
jgi:hypothetical protein